jgi:hypothetical protein
MVRLEKIRKKHVVLANLIHLKNEKNGHNIPRGETYLALSG